MDIVQRAFEYAIKKHGNQMYGNKPYSYHLSAVATLVKSYGLPVEFEIVAALHDVLEDTDVEYGELESLFGHNIATAVLDMTRNKDEKYDDYIMRVSKNKLSKAVKICDLLCNLEESYKDIRYSSLVNKYRKAIFLLAVY